MRGYWTSNATLLPQEKELAAIWNVLVACEYSGIVRDAFTAQGHNAVSCDIRPTESPGEHYEGDWR